MKDVTDVAVVALIAQLAQVLTVGSLGRVLELVATMMRYPALPLTLVQLKLGVVLTFVTPAGGTVRTGGTRLEELDLTVTVAVPCFPLGAVAVIRATPGERPVTVALLPVPDTWQTV